MSKIKLKFIICGTGRCGTVYMAKVLTSLGITCGHESIFNYNGLENAENILSGQEQPQLSKCSNYDAISDKHLDNWIDLSQISADSSYMAAPYLNNDLLKNIPLIHIVRHPLDVITSWSKISTLIDDDENIWRKFIYSHLPQLNEIQGTIEKAAFYYVAWNNTIESSYKNRKVLFYKVEDELTSLTEFLEVDSENPFKDRKANSWRKDNYAISLRHIKDVGLRNDLQEMIKRYGYSIRPIRIH